MDKAVDIIKCKKSIEVFMSEKGITNSFLNKKVIKLWILILILNIIFNILLFIIFYCFYHD